MHDWVGAVVHLEKLQEQGEVRFSAIEKNSQVLLVFVYFSDHQLQKISVVSYVLFLPKRILLRNEFLLVDFYQKVYQLLLLLQPLEQKFKEGKNSPQHFSLLLELFDLFLQHPQKFVLNKVSKSKAEYVTKISSSFEATMATAYSLMRLQNLSMSVVLPISSQI